jgi:hypothetical protein
MLRHAVTQPVLRLSGCESPVIHSSDDDRDLITALSSTTSIFGGHSGQLCRQQMRNLGTWTLIFCGFFLALSMSPPLDILKEANHGLTARPIRN